MQNIFKFLLLAIVSIASLQLVTAQIVEKAEKGAFVLTNATIETITQGTVKGTLVIQDGKITAIGQNVPTPAGAKTIDCTGLFIYPGMIDGGSTLGLSEVGSVSLTQDFNEIGELTPQMQALTAVNPNATAIPVTRVDGVTTTLTTPRGGLFPGTAALINLVGYTPDQMYAGFKGIVMNYPVVRRRPWGGDNRSDEELKKEEEKLLKQVNEVWDQAALYARIDSAARANSANPKPDYNPEMEALVPVLRGEVTLLLEVNRYNDIESAIKWVQDRKIKKVIFTGVAEGWRVADKIAQAGIPVITGPVITVPSRASDRYDKAYANPGLMHKAGVKVAIRTNNSENVRNLPFHAGFAVAYGMDKAAALRAVTITPAEMFSVANRLGSLEVGKSATLFVASGDPFETKTEIRHLFIDGWNVPIDSRHIQLYEEFLNRQPGAKK
ncbi:MAG TPA: amidohydrolase family protein [Saprospiraceae bacterium]|nr:amidohydrolase family protein [Saprospiraceae bacterium]HMP14718.1 amidohydrolase family protein [Saprospiraceae bacterium]